MIGKLKQKKIIDVKTGKVTLSWVGHENSEVNQDSEQLANSVTDSEITEPIMESQNEFSESRTNPELSENQSPELPSDKDYNSPQTYKNVQTIQTEAREEKKAISKNSSNIGLRSDRSLEGEEEKETPQPMSSLSNVLSRTTEIKNCQPNLNRPAIQTPKQHSQNTEIPADIKEKLQQLNIPPIERLRGAINKYHRS